jgi:hypothetical protein
LKSLLNRKLLIGATGLVLLGGAGGAVAVAATSGSSGSGRQAYVDDVAKHLNVTPTALTAAMKAAGYERIEAAVAAGRMTPSQASALKQRIEHGSDVASFGRRLGGGHFGGHGVAAQYLGISAATLRGDLQAGKSLAQIASSTPGKSVEGLKAAIVSAEKTRLEKAASSGLITSQQEQERLGNLSSRVEAMLQRTGTGGSYGRSGSAPLGHW